MNLPHATSRSGWACAGAPELRLLGVVPDTGCSFETRAATIACRGMSRLTARSPLPKNSVGTKQLKQGAVKRSEARQWRSDRGEGRCRFADGQADQGLHARAGAVGRARRERGHCHQRRACREHRLCFPRACRRPARRVGAVRLLCRQVRCGRSTVKLAFGQTQTLFSVGTLTFSATCVENQANPVGVAGQDVVELLVATSQNGAILANGQNGGLFGSNSADFLDTDTARERPRGCLAQLQHGNLARKH